MKLLNWSDVPATVLDVAELLSAERDENTERKAFTPTELVAIGALIEERERPAAIARHRMNGGLKAKKEAATSTVTTKNPCVGVMTAKAMGVAPNTYTFARAVVRAAAADPERFGDLPEMMDTTGQVKPVYRELSRERK